LLLPGKLFLFIDAELAPSSPSSFYSKVSFSGKACLLTPHLQMFLIPLPCLSFSLVLFFLEFIVTNLTKISTVKVQKLVFALFLPTTLTIWLTMIFDETGFNFVVSIISFLALLYPQIEKN
jgi:hypothetical protein